MNSKRGLVVIYDPHALYQFLMFYCAEKDSGITWDALCLPKEGGKEVMHEICEKTGVFEDIYTGNVEYAQLGLGQQLKMFVEMFTYAVSFNRENYCKKILNEYVSDIDRYDVLVGNTESGLITGMLASFATNKRVIYFEDGMADYWVDRKSYRTIFPWFSLINFEALAMSKLGYCAKGFSKFRLSKSCEKYASNVLQLPYKDYKKITQFELDDMQREQFVGLLAKAYPEICNVKIHDNSAILFTDPPSDIYCYESDCKAYNEACVSELDGKYDVIYLKRHPRDTSEYLFKKTANVVEINQSIPAECLLPMLKSTECFFTDLSSTIIAFKTYNLIPIILLDEQKNTKKVKMKGFDKKIMKDMCEKLVGDDYEIRSVL